MRKAVRYWAVIPAAGIGKRMDADLPKQYLTINGKCILEHTLRKFCDFPLIEGVIVAIAADDTHWGTLAISTHPKITMTPGGKERCQSVLNCLQKLSLMAESYDWVLVHDAARPCVRHSDIKHLINSVDDHPVGGLLALPVRDTMKRAGDNNIITTTIERNNLWHALTPQIFRLAPLLEALEYCITNKNIITDEAQAMETCGHYPLLIKGHPDNIKITHDYDLALAELYLEQQEAG